jgi:RNA-directed DNA polymerase
MNGWRPLEYQREGQRRKISQHVLDNTRTIAKLITSVNPALPPIFTLRHLAHLAEVDYGFLRAVVSRELVDPYKTFRIRKRSTTGTPFRMICVPDPQLMRTQRWIAKRVLTCGVPHKASKAYAPGSSIQKAAASHCGSCWLIKLDVRNFFESISEIAAYRVFLRFGYQPLVSLELARVCTRLGSFTPFRRRSRWISSPDRYPAIRSYRNSRIGHLPQGAPTSPMLANLAVQDLDTQLDKISSSGGLVYSRYADDLTFSTDRKEFARADATAMIESLYQCMRRFGLSPNSAKTRIVPPGARKIVLGLLVDTDVPHLSRDFKRQLRQHLYYLKKVGPQQHAERRRFTSVAGLRNHLEGLAAFAFQIEPSYGRQIIERLRMIEWPL